MLKVHVIMIENILENISKLKILVNKVEILQEYLY